MNKARFLISAGWLVGMVPMAGHAQVADPASQQSAPAAEAPSDGDIVVTGIRASLESAVNTKRNAAAVVDSISAEDIGSFPDANLAESLQRITGVQITRSRGEGSQASIRGLSPDFNQVNFNGRTVPSASSGNRSFDFTILSSDLVNGIDVYKSPTANLTEGGLAGSINVRSLRGQDVKETRFVLDAEGIYEQNADKFGPHVSGLFATRLFDDRLGLVVGGDYSKRKLQVYRYEAFGLEPAKENARAPAPLQDYNRDGDNNDTFLINHAANYNVDYGDRTRKTGMASLSFDIAPTFTIWGEGLYSEFHNNTQLAINSFRFTNNSINNSVRNSVIDSNNIVTLLDMDGVDNRNNARGTDQRDKLQSYAAGGDIKTDRATIHFEGSYGRSTSTLTALSLEVLGRASAAEDLRTDPGGPANLTILRGYDPMNASNFNALGVNGQYNSPTKDTVWEAKVDGTWNVDRGILKSLSGGLYYQNRTRAFTSVVLSVNAQQLAPLVGLPYSSTIEGGSFSAAQFMTPFNFPDLLRNYSGASKFPTQFLDSDINKFFAKVPLQTLLSQFGTQTDLASTYSVNEKSMAAYARADFADSSDRLKGNVGLRFINTVSASSGYSADLNTVSIDLAGSRTIVGRTAPVTIKNEYHYFLPSLNAVYSVSDRFLIRFAAARVLSRPTLANLAPAITINANVRTLSGGNPLLKPFTSDQLDLSFEHYLRGGGLVSLAGFYKNVKNFIVSTTGTQTINLTTVQGNVTTPTVFTTFQPGNGGTSKVKGFEASYQQPFTFLPAPFDGFGAILNYTYVSADDIPYAAGGPALPLPGVSKNNYNIVLYYEKGPFSLRGAYNYRDRFVVDPNSYFGDGQFTSPFRQLDVTTSLKLTRNVQVHAEALNLLGESVVNLDKYGINRGYEDYGRRFTAGVRVQF